MTIFWGGISDEFGFTPEAETTCTNEIEASEEIVIDVRSFFALGCPHITAGNINVGPDSWDDGEFVMAFADACMGFWRQPRAHELMAKKRKGANRNFAI